MAFKLHNYQRNLVDKARGAFSDGYTSPCIVAPCGAGKSVIISEIARMTTAGGKRVLFLVHRKELIDQIENSFRLNEVNLNLVQFGMVQTIVRRLERIERPQLIITDESHHGLAKSYRTIYDYFSDVLRLSFTATPIRLNGEGMGDVNDLLIEEIDAEWLIANGYLSPYKYYAPKLIDDDVLKISSMKEFTSKSVDDAIGKVIYGDVVAHYNKLAKDEQAIAYCHSVAASEELAETFNSLGIPSAHIDGKTDKRLREEIISKFRSKEIRLLTNVDLIGEGFDVPDCSTVIMLRPTKSLSLYIQQSMRGMRFKEGKTSIIIDHVGNVQRFGLPDEKREWSLKGKKKQSSEAAIKIKQCPSCYGVYEPIDNICPLCGHENEIIRNNEKTHDENAVLEEIKKGEIKLSLDFREPSDCRNMKELYELAENRGYKKGWAFFQGKKRGFI